jgi:hypothetical protein
VQTFLGATGGESNRGFCRKRKKEKERQRKIKTRKQQKDALLIWRSTKSSASLRASATRVAPRQPMVFTVVFIA